MINFSYFFYLKYAFTFGPNKLNTLYFNKPCKRNLNIFT